MKKKKLERKLRRLEKRLRITEVNKRENDTKIPGIRYYATKEEIAEVIQEIHRCQSVKSL